MAIGTSRAVAHWLTPTPGLGAGACACKVPPPTGGTHDAGGVVELGDSDQLAGGDYADGERERPPPPPPPCTEQPAATSVGPEETEEPEGVALQKQHATAEMV